MTPAERHANLAVQHRGAMPDAEIDKRMGHSAKSQQVLTGLLNKPHVSFADVARALVEAANDGAMTHMQALTMAGKMPSDPAGLQSFMQYLQEAAIHTHGLLLTEKTKRAAMKRTT